MYKSPIEIIMTDLQHRIVEDRENHIVNTIQQEIGVNVDKQELTKALQYDRNQYQKGYEDGMKDFAERLKKSIKKSVDDAWHSDGNGIYDAERVLDDIDNLLKETVGENNG